MQRNAWTLSICLAVALVLSGCGGSSGLLGPIIGEWTYDSAQHQRWTWEFPNDKTVRFSLDDQKRKWSITDIRVRGSIIEIDIDEFLGRGDDASSTIKVEILTENDIFVSSGLHPGLPFEHVDE